MTTRTRYRAAHRAATVLVLLITSCEPVIPDGVFACVVNSDCPSSFVCDGTRRCRSRAADAAFAADAAADATYADAGGADASRDAAVDAFVAADAAGADACGHPVSAETCNGQDDDCNGRVDDGAEASCAPRANALTVCTAGRCGFVCDALFTDCDGRPDNGCESTTGACAIAPPRPLSPLSDVVVTSRRPEFRFDAPAGVLGRVEVCSDPTCNTPVWTGTGVSPVAVGVDLPPGRYHWRVRGVVGLATSASASVVRRFTVFAKITPNRCTSAMTFFNVNGGPDDVLVGQPDLAGGRVHLYAGDSAVVAQTLASTRAGFGSSVAPVGDLNGDGFGDAVVGACIGNDDGGAAPPANCGDGVDVFVGRADGTLDPAPFASLSAPTGAEGFGYSVSAAGDFNRDGYADFVVGAYFGCRAYVYLGGPTALDLARIDLLPGGTDPGDGAGGGLFGASVSGAGDFNGDGFGDVIVGQPVGMQLAHVFLGAASANAHGGEIVIFGPTATTRFGHSVAGAGDVNADGIGDVIVGGDAGPGYANIVAGSWLYAAGSQVKVSLRSLVGANAGASFGASVVGLGDVNGDGYCDVAASSPNASPPSVQVFAGGGVPSSVPIASIGDPMISFGRSLGVAGLSDGDVRADLLVGACSTASPNACSNVARIYAGLSSAGSSTFRSWSWSPSEPYFGAAVSR